MKLAKIPIWNAILLILIGIPNVYVYHNLVIRSQACISNLSQFLSVASNKRWHLVKASKRGLLDKIFK